MSGIAVLGAPKAPTLAQTEMKTSRDIIYMCGGGECTIIEFEREKEQWREEREKKPCIIN